LTETVVREVREETSLDATVQRLAYVSESYDGDTHFVNTTFEINVSGELRKPKDDHVVEAVWVPLDVLAPRIAVAVVREPLLAYLADRLPARYAGFHRAGVTISFEDDA
jgi:ADP-ribose pyrophosphatase YjhB (NUDIX family)